MRRSRPSPNLNRGRPTRELNPLHIVLCEGRTEARCIEDLRKHHRQSAIRVEVHDQQGVPWTLVERARGHRDVHRRSPGPVTVHVVFDRDEHPRFDDAVDRARALGLSVGVSVPCFELWALLLHQDQTAPIHRHDAQRSLRDVHPGYDHEKHPYLRLDAVLPGLRHAAHRAAHLRHRAGEAGAPHSNPVTTFDEVLERLFPRPAAPPPRAPRCGR